MHTTNIRSSERRAYGTLYWGAKFLNEVNPFQRLSQCHRCHDNRTGTELLRRSWGYLLVILLVLLVSLSGGLGDTVKITLAGLGDAAAALLLVVLNDANLLEGLEDLAVDGAGGVEVVRRTDTTVLGRAVELAETADTDGLAEVDVAGDGGSADVEPVNVLGRELLGGTGLDDINPAGNGELALTLQESRVGSDELLRIDIANGNAAGHFEGIVGGVRGGLVVG